MDFGQQLQRRQGGRGERQRERHEREGFVRVVLVVQEGGGCGY